MIRRIFLAAMLVLTFLAGCGGGGGGGNKATLAEAQTFFNDGDYEGALQAYTDLISSEGAPAIAGAGWSAIRLKHYSQADSFFTTFGPIYSLNADGYAGWSFAEWARGDVSNSLNRATSAFNAAPPFTSLSFDSRVTANHLIWIQASCYLQTGFYNECYSKILLLDHLYDMPTGTVFEVGNALLQKLQSLGVASTV